MASGEGSEVGNIHYGGLGVHLQAEVRLCEMLRCERVGWLTSCDNGPRKSNSTVTPR